MVRLHRVRFFLASSDELAPERDHVELIVLRKNAVAIKHELFLEVVRWEALTRTAERTKIQEYFNGQISTCDAMIALFHSRVGTFTKEELSIALERYESGENPKYVYLYFKDSAITFSELTKGMAAMKGMADIQKLKEKLQKAQLMIYDEFDSPEALELSLSRQLDFLIEDLRQKHRPIVISRDKVLSQASQIPTDSSATNRVLTMTETRELAERVGLLTEWTANPHLTQNAGDISFYQEQQVSAGRLEAQFRARVLLLEEADRVGFRFLDPGDLSERATEIESRILDAWVSKTEGAAGT